jgi:hypothetical protein
MTEVIDDLLLDMPDPTLGGGAVVKQASGRRNYCRGAEKINIGSRRMIHRQLRRWDI